MWGEDKENGTTCECPDRCEKITYQTKLSAAKYPSLFYQFLVEQMYNMSRKDQRYALVGNR